MVIPNALQILQRVAILIDEVDLVRKILLMLCPLIPERDLNSLFFIFLSCSNASNRRATASVIVKMTASCIRYGYIYTNSNRG